MEDNRKVTLVTRMESQGAAVIRRNEAENTKTPRNHIADLTSNQ